MFTLKKYILYLFILSFFLISCNKTDKNNETNEITSEGSQENSKIICDKFDIKWNLKDNLLNLWLSTDLPDDTDIIVSISRYYKEKGNSANYSIDYFSEKSSVKKYRTKNIVKLDDSIWKDALKAKQNEMAALGLGFDVGKISNEIGIRLVVPVRQSSPKFGNKNVNLEGKKVKTTGLRIVEGEIKINKKLGSKYSGGSSISTNPLSLEVGIAYIITQKTPLMPELNPTNPELALKKMIELPPNSIINILKVERKNNSPWYNVDAINNNSRIGTGWINSNALLGQKLTIK